MSERPAINDDEFGLEMYRQFINFELREADGASFFQILHPAPDNVSIEALEELAESCRLSGWDAELVAFEREAEGFFGIKIMYTPPMV